MGVGKQVDRRSLTFQKLMFQKLHLSQRRWVSKLIQSLKELRDVERVVLPIIRMVGVIVRNNLPLERAEVMPMTRAIVIGDVMGFVRCIIFIHNTEIRVTIFWPPHRYSCIDQRVVQVERNRVLGDKLIELLLLSPCERSFVCAEAVSAQINPPTFAG